MKRERTIVMMTSKIESLLRGLGIDPRDTDISMFHERYAGMTVEFTSDILGENNCLALDLPILIKSQAPISKVKNPAIAIVGEAPARKDPMSHLGNLSVGLTFGQHNISFYERPRVYDMVIDWYLSKGFDVYLTNLSKTLRYVKREMRGQKRCIQKPISQDASPIIEEIEEEMRAVKPSHIVWLGDAQWKKFIYGESVAQLHIDWTCFPHPSGANNNAWVEKLKSEGENLSSTDYNKFKYIVSKTNVLYVGNDGTLHSTIES